jgi:hypothetical protein
VLRRREERERERPESPEQDVKNGQAVWGGSEVGEVDEGMQRAEWLCRGHHFPQSSMGAVRVPGLAISRYEPGSLGSKRALATPARRFSTRHTLGGRPLSWLRARPPRWRCHVCVFGLTAVLMLMLVLVLVPVPVVRMFMLMAAVCLSKAQADRACCQPVSPAQRPPSALAPVPVRHDMCVSTLCYCC